MSAQLHDDEDDNGLFTNKSTMMANFEEWIKMATDNKINSRNSWNFALIDYFHDLNVLKDEEDNINFQKASATLDGCVKIYSHRVDSIATETGKLLSGLTERKNKKGERSGLEGEGGDSDSNHDDSIEIDPSTGLPMGRDTADGMGKKNRTYNRVLETTLVDFDSIRLKDLAQNLSIDPLFKKALADFDEGGAKSLLINTLHIDKNIRVVFDATTKEPEQERKDQILAVGTDNDTSTGHEQRADISDTSNEHASPRTPDKSGEYNLDISSAAETSLSLIEDDILDLGIKFLDFSTIESSTICPSMDQLHSAVADIGKAKTFVEGVNAYTDNFLSEKDLESVREDYVQEEYDYDPPQEDEGEALNEGGSMVYDAQVNDFQDSQIHNTAHTSHQGPVAENSQGDTSVLDQELLSYFDSAIGQNWRGREHWKVRNIKLQLKKDTTSKVQQVSSSTSNDTESHQEKKSQKKQTTIDFFDLSEDIEEVIFSNKKAFLELPIKQRTNASHYLLPNDYKFTTDKITKLFIKPTQKMTFFSHKKNSKIGDVPGSLKFDDTGLKETSRVPEIADEHFWAENYDMHEREQSLANTESQIDKLNVPSFEEDNGIDFNQAFEDEDLDMDTKEDLIDTQSMFPNNKVAYSRTSKKVDVRKLKNNVWKSISQRLHSLKTEEEEQEETRKQAEEEQVQQTDNQLAAVNEHFYDLKFTDIAKDIVSLYSANAKKDLSTSFCFICLLHLANEHGFTITDTCDYQDLDIKFPEKIADAVLSNDR